MIDHIIYVDPNLERAIEHFSHAYGITARPGGSHLGFGTRNALAGLGEGRYLELMGIDPGQDVPASKRFFSLDANFTPRFASWCARAPRPLSETVAIARGAGCDLGEIFAMSRARPDGSTLAWTLTSPFADRAGGVVPFYIDWGDAPNPASTMPPLLSLVSLTVRHPAAPRVRAILDALGETEVAVEEGPAPALDVVLR